MTYEITEELIPDLPRKAYRNGVGKPEGVVLHETGAWGGTALSNRDYEDGNWNSAFVHYFVDWEDIVQVADTDYLAWGCGHPGNQRFVQIELVRTRDKDKFVESYKRYVWLVAKMLHQYNLSPKRLDTLWTHHDVTDHLGDTNHTDPDAYLEYHDYTVDQLISDIKKVYNGDGTGHIDERHKVGAAHAVTLLKKGDKGDMVKSVQKKLRKLGFYGGNIDGIFGPKTEEAVKKFQKSEHISVDGIVGPVTEQHLEEAHPIPYPGHLFEYREGHPMQHGHDVKIIQKRLNARLGEHLKVDGWYGRKTSASVRQFQRQNNLHIDGIVGRHTWSKLF